MNRPVPLDGLLGGIAGLSVAGDPRVMISGITHDSRRVEPGFLFAALRGEKTDGLAFASDALARGAAGVLCDRPRPRSFECPWVLADDARAALARIARALHGAPDERLPVIGITGTNGKTTVALLLDAIIRATGRRAGVLGTISYRIGSQDLRASHTTPEADALFAFLGRMADEGCSHAVMEVSSHALAMKRVLGLRFAAAIFTNLTQDHLDFHGTMEEYFAAKSLLFRDLSPDSLAVLNTDSPFSARIASMTRARVVTYGAGERSDFRIGKVASSFEGTRFDLTAAARSWPVVCQLPGTHGASNAAAAIAAALSLGIPEDAVLSGVMGFPGAPGRFEKVSRGQDFRVIVDYAHTPDALENLLGAVRELRPARILTVFGCGGDRDRAKRPLMGSAAARGSDEVILTSDNPRSEDPERILDDAEAGVLAVPGAARRYRRIVDRREAIATAIAVAQPGDAVLIAGKGHEDYQILRDRTIPFDDRLVAAECLDLRLGH